MQSKLEAWHALLGDVGEKMILLLLTVGTS